MNKSQIIKYLLSQQGNKNFVAGKTSSSLSWVRTQIDALLEGADWSTKIKNTEGTSIGHIHLFQYSPKHKDTLPYYDKFPLALIIGPSAEGDGMLGINFHYLSPTKRAQFMLALYAYEEGGNINVSYSDLVSNYALRFYKPCIKKYLFNHIIGSPFYRVPQEEWNTMLFLPTQRFAKSSASAVWRKSAASI